MVVKPQPFILKNVLKDVRAIDEILGSSTEKIKAHVTILDEN